MVQAMSSITIPVAASRTGPLASSPAALALALGGLLLLRPART
jgi:hypothetical protein